MRDKSAAFSNATEALSQLGIPDVLSSLREADIYMRRSILGGSHSVVTYPPLNALRLLNSGDDIHPIFYGPTTSLYVHVAFCETNCTFCHYAVRTYRGKEHSSQSRIEVVDRYLNALEREADDWAKEFEWCCGTEINSIYIGGGTPLILEREQLVGLLQMIRSKFRVAPDAEICVEGSPLTITALDGLEKLQALKQQGVTRLSFGIQSFDNDVLHGAARGYDRKTAIRACEMANLVFDHWNIDLIQSLSNGTPDEVWENLQVLRDVRPPHLTWYHGRFASNRPQADWIRSPKRQLSFENEQDTLLGRMLLWEELADMGYGQIDGNRFVRDERFVDPFKKIRTSVNSNLLGIGASSYSHVDMREHPRWPPTIPEGVFFRNTPDIGQYMEIVEKGESPVTTALALDAGEYHAASYVVGLRTGRPDATADEWAERYYPEEVAKCRELAQKLLELDLLERVKVGDETVLRLSRRGQLFEDEVLSRFYSLWVEELLGEPV